MFRHTRRLARLAVFSAVCLSLLEQATARAGGAGGHSSGGSHGGSSHSYGGSGYGGGGFSIHSSNYYGGGGSTGSFGVGSFIILLIFIAVIIYLWLRAQKDTSGVVAEPIGELPEEGRAVAELRKIDPSFDLEAFRAKARRAFLKIQQAWSARDISQARVFISDGIYQRYTTQLHMMRLLEQENLLSNIQLHMVQPVTSRIDGAYQVLDVKITAAMEDRFICHLDRDLDQAGDGIFTEYWTFIRKLSARGSSHDLTSAANCPSCGAALPPSMGEICRCEHCQVMINSGEFDWVLCEITQADDYGRGSFDFANPVSGLAELRQEAPDFSQALIEDKASNAIMQVLSAISADQMPQVRRFLSDEIYQALVMNRPQPPFAYSRLYLNEVSLLNVTRTEKRHRLRLGLVLSRQRIRRFSNRQIELEDDGITQTQILMDLERDISAAPPAGALYQHQCPCCGGAIADTTDTRCVYCGSELNSPSYEWIVTHLEAQSGL
jgi:Tim44-like domain